jgi:hypothetical protein
MKALEAISQNLLTYSQFGTAIAKLPKWPSGAPYRLLVIPEIPVMPLSELPARGPQIHELRVSCKRVARNSHVFWVWDCNPESVEFF